jgi:hypothetical protein
LVFFLGSPRYRGDIAERRVRRILGAGLESNRYTVFHDVVLPSGGGTARIDHLVVSKSGIFVIDSIYAPGRVDGSEVQERWRRKRFGRASRFDNPVHRNRVHVDAVAAALNAPVSVMQGAVVLVGAQLARDGRPVQVVEPERLLGWIRRAGQPKLDEQQVARALRGIESARLVSANGGARAATLLRWLLFAALLSGLWLAFGDEARHALDTAGAARERAQNPADFHPDGRAKTPREVWEDSLVCAWSQDTGRCACYDPQGERVTLAEDECRALAERGSILKQ